MPLTVPSVVNIFVKLRRVKEKSKADSLEFTSGDPITHPSLSGEDATCKRRVPLVHGDMFLCTGAVDVPKLLRGSRASLLEKAEFLGATVLVEESWECNIRIPKNRKDGTYRVQVRYYASASRSSRPDPQKPVALDKVRNVPGLMTIVGRDEFAP
ncbi:hypothetical protein HYDPIDRAFT_115265 [Hydnomerulius pinastri MD-312]|uniref:Unplaced genomic scaffold scaffold_25, whole genome shotgun sequence n=1 Tax=Hydnomerulius pinastri MD-312 TaxID=994086 RepID=A0A0C9WC64_9AGAM|nr:hypothetical protein HYDPIDRAFT_115265 [Hydnomerulius pinastri MD-312]